MLRNVVFRLNREIKMRRNSKIVKKPREIKMLRKFHAVKISYLKVFNDGKRVWLTTFLV